MKMSEVTKLTQDDLLGFRAVPEEAIALVKYYSAQYISKVHYEHLGASCVISATKTIDAIIGSTEYLVGKFIMPDEIHVERLVEWFVNNRDYKCERFVLTFFMAHYIKRKINSFYRSINHGEFSTTFTILGNNVAREEFNKEYNKRKSKGVKMIRQ